MTKRLIATLAMTGAMVLGTTAVATAAPKPKITHVAIIVKGNALYLTWDNNASVQNITITQDGVTIGEYSVIESYGRKDFSAGSHTLCATPSDASTTGKKKCRSATVA